MFAIACGYEDADDCDALRTDPLFKLAVGRAPESGRALCSQPTMSRLENALSRIEVARMTAALVDLFCRSFSAPPPAAITLDIDDTCDPVHGRQQLSLFNGHYDTRCFLPVHVYHVRAASRWRLSCARARRRPGAEVRTLLKHLVRRIRRHWPRTPLTFRGDSHYGRDRGHGMVRGQRRRLHLRPGGQSRAASLRIRRRRRPQGAPRRGRRGQNAGLRRLPLRRRLLGPRTPGRRPAGRPPRAASTPATSSPRSPARPAISTKLSIAPAARPRTSIKLHKVQLASDRTSCQSPARQPVPPRPAHRGLLADARPARCRAPQDAARLGQVRDPQEEPAQGSAARVVESAARIRIHFASACPDAALFRLLAGRLAAAGP